MRPERPNAITRLAVGVDGYPEGRDAVAFGALIAGVTDADMTLVMVHPDPPAPRLTETDPEKEAEAVLTEVRASIAPSATIVTETDLSVPAALHRVVVRERCDLLVVGSSRRATHARVRIGRCTRQLLSRVDCALAIAPRGSKRVRLRNIGVGYDGSPESEAALALAGSLAVAAHAELHIRAVVDDRVRRLVCSALGGLVATEAVDVVVQEEERLRDRTAAATNAIDANVEAQVRRGNPSEVLLTLCNDVDLLVFGSRRWGAIARVVLGRTGEAVARDAGCPLLVVPRPAS